MRADLEILLGVNAEETVGRGEPLPFNEEVLEAAVEEVIGPLVENGALEDPEREGYIHQKVIPGAQMHLIREAVAEDPVEAMRGAFRVHDNLLHATEVTKATDFLEEVTPDAVRDRVEDLLRGTGSLTDRLQRFLEWGSVRPGPEGQSIGFNGTAASYLLAADNPAAHAFCKPTVYQAAAEALLGEEQVVAPKNEAKRIAHATRLYGSVARLMRQRYNLPIRDLFHVHTAFYFLADNPHYDTNWEDLRTDFREETNYYWLNCNPNMWDPRTLSVGGRNTYTARNKEGGKRRVYECFERRGPATYWLATSQAPCGESVGSFASHRRSTTPRTDVAASRSRR